MDIPGTNRAAGAVLAVGAFAVGMDPSAIAGVLPSVAADLQVDVEAAGQLVTVFAVAYALLGPVLAMLTGAVRRRPVLLAGLGIFSLGNALTAVAPSYSWALGAMAVAAAGAALYTPSAIATIAALTGPGDRSRRMSTVVLGLTLSAAFGVPIGTVFGAEWGWRGTMWFVVALGGAAAVVVACFVDAPGSARHHGLAERLAPLRDRRVLLLLAVTLTAFTGTYAVSSYVSLVFGEATGGSGYRLAVLLFVSGVAGAVGNVLAGLLTDRFGARLVLLVVLPVLAVDLALVPLAGKTMTGALAALAVYGLTVWSVTVPQQRRLIAAASSAPSVVLSLNSSAIHVAVALGTAAGGVITRFAGAAFVTAFAAVLVAAGLGISEKAERIRLETPRVDERSQ
ncbi:MFS transporter [Lentzea sp. JNUCC 0626]|uniref:MFS transporter n=1 Tax=Lentzea sp. JNUCC 0626 TaxID=3367513 RepID=UPI00374A700D